MTNFQKFFALAAILVASVSVAKADSISGSIGIAGADTATSATGVTFDPTTGIVVTSAGDFSSFTFGTVADLTSFTYASADGVVVFTTTEGGTTVSFTITGITSVTTTDGGNAVAVSGTGIFSETGYSNTDGSFELTSNTDGTSSFSLDSSAPTTIAATPEPDSLMLLGTGLVGSAGMLIRRRRVV